MSGDAVDAVRTLQAELSSDYSEMRSAEIQLTEAILTAHAVTVSGRTRLQDIQRQLIEAINNPVTALDTPAGGRHCLNAVCVASCFADSITITTSAECRPNDDHRETGHLAPAGEHSHTMKP